MGSLVDMVTGTACGKARGDHALSALTSHRTRAINARSVAFTVDWEDALW